MVQKKSNVPVRVPSQSVGTNVQSERKQNPEQVEPVSEERVRPAPTFHFPNKNQAHGLGSRKDYKQYLVDLKHRLDELQAIADGTQYMFPTRRWRGK